MDTPYAAPSAPLDDHDRPLDVFRPPRSGILRGALYLCVAFELFIVLVDVAGTVSYPTWNDNNAELQDSGELALVSLMTLGALGNLATFVAAVVLFCVWIHRANRNARALGSRGMSITPAASVFWWFIPIANLFKPYEAMREIFQASHPRSAPHEWKSTDVPGIFLLWWFSWILTNVLGQIAFRLSLSDDPDTVASSTWVSVASLVFSMVACVTVVSIVRRIDERQMEKSDAVLSEQ